MDVDLSAIDGRLAQLAEAKSNKAYERQKSALQSQLEAFLSSLPVPKCLASASPCDIRRFLVWKDSSGRTVVHQLSCPSLGQRRSPRSCACPTRLAAGTVDSVIGKLRSIFAHAGLGGEWDDRLGIGNPASHPSIKAYLKCIREEQAQARVQPRKAVPLFADKLVAIARHILAKLGEADTSPASLYILSRDLSFMSIDFFGGDRASDLGRAKSSEVLFFPDDSGLLVNHTFGKTLRGDSTHSFTVRRCDESLICPVVNFKIYLDICRAIKVDISRGYLFRSVTRKGHISKDPFVGSAVYNRLKGYLKELSIDDGETPHSARSGCSITMELLGVPKDDIARHIGWRSAPMVDHYNDLGKTIKAGNPASVLAASQTPGTPSATSAQEAVSSYRILNSLEGFKPAFQ